MRRVLLLLTLAVISALAVAAVASARTETRFSVIASKGHAHKLSARSFLVHGRLSQADNNNVGSYKAKFTFLRRHTVRLRAVATLRGEGSLKARGTFDPTATNSRVPIIGGSGEFNGAAGKLKIHNLPHGRAILEFHFVQ